MKEKIKKHVILLDGAFGTYIQSLGLNENDYAGGAGCMERLSVTRPDLIERVHADYLEAGSDAVETNTFGANAVKLKEYGLEKDAYSLNFTSARIARSVADKFSSVSQKKYVIGSMGPTGKLPSSTDLTLGNIGYDEIKQIYKEQSLGLIDGGCDALLVETAQDILEMKAAALGAREALRERGKDLMLIGQCTLANNGRMLLGTDISAVYTTLSYLGVDVIGLNCSTGPIEMESSIRHLSEKCPAYISCVPNAGLPVELNGETVYPMKPVELAEILGQFLKKYRIDILGGCCGTTPEHIKEIRKMIGKKRKTVIPKNCSYSSFYRSYDLKEMDRPIKVGERINSQGSRVVKDLLKEENYDQIIEIGKKQQNAGADILDICTVLTERSTEARDSVIITKRLNESVQIPLMVDSTDLSVIEKALKNYPGTAFINSVNLEDGGKKAREVFRLAKEHAAFVVNLAIDEKGMGKTVKDKLDISEKLYRIATEEFHLEPHRLFYDMLTFTLGTGEEEYRRAAVNTYEAIRKFKKRHPNACTVLGVSNISFGLSKEARKVLNMVFLHHAVRNGLDAAIVNPSEYVRYENIEARERALADDLIFNKHRNALTEYVGYFDLKPGSAKNKREAEQLLTLKPAEKIKKCIFDRDNTSIVSLLDEALKDHRPEEIINDVLMPSMKEVGDRLDRGEMVLPYVLQSAEVMRKAIQYLERFIAKENNVNKGKILLATVFGDVHDIGKNLVKMLLENNGFSVIDLGKQVPIKDIVKQAVEKNVDAVGLSALLVSTARYMKTCVQEMHNAGLDYPILIGGAPINKEFARDISFLEDKSVYKGGVFYAKDAFFGMKIIRALLDPSAKEKVMHSYHAQFSEKEENIEKTVIKKEDPYVRAEEKAAVDIPVPPFFGIRTLNNIPADDVFPLLNEKVLFNSSWGVKLREVQEKEALIEKEFRPLLGELKEEMIRRGLLDLKAVYGYFKCSSEEGKLQIFDKEGKKIEELCFEKPDNAKNITITDYFRKSAKGKDVVAFQAVTVGGKINGELDRLNSKGEVAKAFFLHGLSVNLAEALAEYVHGIIRSELGLRQDQGKRYSPGYPLWEDLKDQTKLFKLLEIEKRIGLKLTGEYQMVPEQSTTAMVLHNTRAEY